MGQGTNPRTGTFLELPQNRDRREPIAPDELRSSCAKAPFPGAFALTGPGGMVATDRLLIRWGRGRGSKMAHFSFAVISQIMVLR